MLLVAPGLFILGAGAFGLLIALAWIAGVAGFGLFIYGLVAKSGLERGGKYCSDCGTLNPLAATYCVSCGEEILR